MSQIQSSFIVPASGIQDLASFSRVPAVQNENGPDDDSSIHTANIVIIGDRAVGKTSIARVNWLIWMLLLVVTKYSDDECWAADTYTQSHSL